MNKLLLTCISALMLPLLSQAQDLYLVAGSYSSADAKGIKVYKFDEVNGAANEVTSVAGVYNPSYLTVKDNLIFAVSEGDKDNSAVTVLEWNAQNNTLTKKFAEPTKGAGPCYVNIVGGNVITANYAAGSMSVLPILGKNKLRPAKEYQFVGRGRNDERQTQPHPHCISTTPDGKYILISDFGTDNIMLYTMRGNSVHPNESRPSIKVPDESGPRHIVWHPNGKYMYIICELSGHILVYGYNKGVFTPLQDVVAEESSSMGSADIQISPDGKFVYSSHRLWNDGIAIFTVSMFGNLKKVGYVNTGVHPRAFTITPNGKYLLVAARDDNKIQIFSRDEATGMISDTGKYMTMDKPVVLKWIK